MNYKLIYDSLITRAQGRALSCYKESHHIIPECMGGPDTKENRVDLTPEEHYLAHQLLVKIYPDSLKLSYAAIKMTVSNEYQQRNNKMYGWLKRKHSENITKTQTGKVYTIIMVLNPLSCFLVNQFLKDLLKVEGGAQLKALLTIVRILPFQV